ncbi:MAG: hypothetical protein K6G75_03680 [Lachnospiraceae bacterium]|nr:hypothetical protein [Lachnospiraceae bacterium]
MKYVVLLCEGMSDEPLDELEGRTPLAVAKSSHMDTLARVSEVGMVHTIPKGVEINSGTAYLAILGYDPANKENSEEESSLLDDFYTKTGKRAAVVSADENIKKISEAVNIKYMAVEGATGGLNTNYGGKKDAAIAALFEEDMDMVFVHVKALDEASRQKSLDKKIQGIESIDAYLVGPLMEEIQGRDVEFRVLVMPDFPTYVRMGDATSDAVPYMLYDSGIEVEGSQCYSEKSAKESGNYFDDGNQLLSHLLEEE